MKKLVLIAIAVLVGASYANAINIKRVFQDYKFPTQKSVEAQTFTNPAAAGTDDVLSAEDGPSSAAAASITTFDDQPDVPRNLVITPGGSTGDVASCVVTVSGTSFLDGSISEAFSFSANASTATTGSKAFKTVTSVAFAASCEDAPFAATWDVGYGEKLGLKRCMDAAGDILFSTIDGAKEATAPTMAASATAVESNTADFNGTMDGSSDFNLYFFQNFRCSP